MFDVVMDNSIGEPKVKLSDGRTMLFEDFIREYGGIWKDKTPRNDITELKVGEWFRIDREVINKNKEEIHRQCNEEGYIGKSLWEGFEKSNKIADENPDQYPRLIETYIFEYNWDSKTEQEMLDMCKDVGDGICDEVICDLELQMRICNGESVHDLTHKPDKLPYERFIRCRNGDIGHFGGGDRNLFSPSELGRDSFYPFIIKRNYTPYAYRKVI